MNVHEVVRGPYRLTRPRQIPDEARPSDHECIVIQVDGPAMVLAPGELPTSGMGWRFRNSAKVYRIVDTSHHTDIITEKLGSRDPGLKFECSVQVTWKVAEPVGALASPRINVARLVRGVFQRLREVSRRQRMEDVVALENWIAGTDLRGVADRAVGFIHVSELLIAIECDEEWELKHRERKLKEQTRAIAREDREDASQMMGEKHGIEAAAVVNDPTYATRLADDIRRRQDEDRQWLRESERAKREFDQKMEWWNSQRRARLEDSRLQGQIAVLEAKMRSSDTEDYERPGIWAAMEALFDQLADDERVPAELEPLTPRGTTREEVQEDADPPAFNDRSDDAGSHDVDASRSQAEHDK